MDGNQDTKKPAVALTIAGFDPSSGAGATADLQVFASMGLFGTACLTALTVQSTIGVARMQTVDAGLLREMLQFLISDMPPDGIKVGMLGSAAITRVVADFLRDFSSKRNVPVVIDPVLRSSSGALLLEESAISTFLEELAPRATCLTPNRDELAFLRRSGLLAPEEVDAAANDLLQRSGARSVIVTGGDGSPPTDLLVEPEREPVWIAGTHVETSATHGTGCAFSSALLSRLVLGDALPDAARAAKLFVENSLRSAPDLGAGKGPMKLSWSPYAR